MQLRVARLCLDCEEIHDAQECPVCASEAFAFLSRWVLAPERRSGRRPAQRPTTAAANTRRALVGAGVLGAVAFGVTRWSQGMRARLDDLASRQESGELK
jgi:hypothetical protein